MKQSASEPPPPPPPPISPFTYAAHASHTWDPKSNDTLSRRRRLRRRRRPLVTQIFELSSRSNRSASPPLSPSPSLSLPSPPSLSSVPEARNLSWKRSQRAQPHRHHLHLNLNLHRRHHLLPAAATSSSSSSSYDLSSIKEATPTLDLPHSSYSDFFEAHHPQARSASVNRNVSDRRSDRSDRSDSDSSSSSSSNPNNNRVFVWWRKQRRSALRRHRRRRQQQQREEKDKEREEKEQKQEEDDDLLSRSSPPSPVVEGRVSEGANWEDFDAEEGRGRWLRTESYGGAGASRGRKRFEQKAMLERVEEDEEVRRSATLFGAATRLHGEGLLSDGEKGVLKELIADGDPLVLGAEEAFRGDGNRSELDDTLLRVVWRRLKRGFRE